MLILIVSLSISSTDLSYPISCPSFPGCTTESPLPFFSSFYGHTSPDVCIFIVTGLETSPTHCDLSSFYLSSLTSSPKEMLKLIFQKHFYHSSSLSKVFYSFLSSSEWVQHSPQRLWDLRTVSPVACWDKFTPATYIYLASFFHKNNFDSFCHSACFASEDVVFQLSFASENVQYTSIHFSCDLVVGKCC